MASKCISILTQLPKDVVDIVEKELNQFNSNFNIAQTFGGIDLKTRDSKTTWISYDHWIGGFCYHYVNKLNRENFQYNIEYHYRIIPSLQKQSQILILHPII